MARPVMKKILKDDIDRVTGRAVVTGFAKYAAEHEITGINYGVLVGSNITSGRILAIDTRTAENAPGIVSVITHLNTPKVPAYDYEAGSKPIQSPIGGKGLQIFNGPYVYFNGQPIALVIADTFERATYAASLVKARYEKNEPTTNFDEAGQSIEALTGDRYKDYVRGDAEAFKSGPVTIDEEYLVPIEVHSPMELHATTAMWTGDDKVTVYDKTQGLEGTQRSIMTAFKLKEEDVQVYAPFVGGGFGSALRTWPHVIAALLGAKKTGKPLKLVLTRPQMFYMVGYRPYTKMRIQASAEKNGKLIGLSHTADSVTSMYEEFNERSVGVSRIMYACPNVFTRYRVFPFNISTPTWMRGPGEATGAFALECALDELSYKLNIDPIELRLINYAKTDPDTGKPYSTKFLKEAYKMGADKIGWKERSAEPAAMKEEGWQLGYGMSTGVFGAHRGTAKVLARLLADGTLTVQSSVSDSGPGTATSMTRIAADAMGMDISKIKFELGDSSMPPGPTQGGSSTTATLGSAVHEVCMTLKSKLVDLVKENPVFHTTEIHNVKPGDIMLDSGNVVLKADRSKKLSFADVLKSNNLPHLELTQESKPNDEMKDYVAYSYSAHFVKVWVHPLNGMVRIKQVAIAGDAGKIISYKTAESQMIGGAIGGIGMALMEEGVIDDRYGRWINDNFADYHVPIQADVPHIDALFVDKPDFILNPIGAKGMGEIALIGFAAAVANAVYHATGKRIRDLPITPDKLI